MSTSSISQHSLSDDDRIHFSSDSSSDKISLSDDSPSLQAPTTNSTNNVAQSAIASTSSNSRRGGLSPAEKHLREKTKDLNQEVSDFRALVGKHKDREGEIIKSPATAIGMTGLLMVVMVICVVVFGIVTGGAGLALIMPMMVAGGLMAAFALSKYQYDLTVKQLPYSNVEDELGKMNKYINRLNQLIDNPNVLPKQKYDRYLELQTKILGAGHALGLALLELEATESAKHKQPIIDDISTNTNLEDAIRELDDAITGVTHPSPPARRPNVDSTSSDEDDDSQVSDDSPVATQKKQTQKTHVSGGESSVEDEDSQVDNDAESTTSSSDDDAESTTSSSDNDAESTASSSDNDAESTTSTTSSSDDDSANIASADSDEDEGNDSPNSEDSD